MRLRGSRSNWQLERVSCLDVGCSRGARVMDGAATGPDFEPSGALSNYVCAQAEPEESTRNNNIKYHLYMLAEKN
jgi:hypothetical protein